ncbi:hypothetical protein EV681_4534 [Advenella incenata]|uniref:Plasmid segregation oscillating ATPase ParF n=1 Tax=Advenella incenata TaxID=267800 RepID=A0A4Q7V412_9BURK|nr:StbB family protein [Advenella incenata]RZT91181.1 hypothetical protein EV681_4534 [Advenella incenata]
MKIAVLNNSGNVGKSTIAKHLLMPRLTDSIIIPIETINDSDIESPHFKGKNFKDVLVELAIHDNVVVDIGSSNIETTISEMRKLKGSHEDFDFYVVPTVPSQKQQIDTMQTIAQLLDIGIPANKIRIIFNMVDQDETVESLFPKLATYCKELGLQTESVIYQSDLFPMLKDLSIREAAEMNETIKTKLKAETDTDEKRRLASLLAASRLAVGVEDNLNSVFQKVFHE